MSGDPGTGTGDPGTGSREPVPNIRPPSLGDRPSSFGATGSEPGQTSASLMPLGTPLDRRPYLLEQIDDAAVVQVYADGFTSLTLGEKMLVWHLYRAAIAGRDIYYDQRHRHNLAMRDLLEAIVTHSSGLDEATLAEITRYTKLFWINTGPYNNLTARKFTLKLDRERLLAAAEIAVRNGARFGFQDRSQDLLQRAEIDRLALAELVDRLVPMFFDPSFEPMVTNKTPGEGQDILASSANNMYRDVTMADLDSFVERHPLNSRLVKTHGGLVEEVYRVGGIYDAEIRRIIGHLEDAIAYAPDPLAQALRALIRFYQTGRDFDREAFDIAWVQNRESTVDTMNGFIEVYMDARGVKGSWEGVVYYANHEKTKKIRTIADQAQWFEDRMPFDARYRKSVVQGVTGMAIEVVIETGDSGPVTPIGVNLPNDQRIREEFGSKSVSLTNVLDAYERSTLHSYREEFAWDEAEVERATRWGAFAGELTTDIHEVLGHGSGRMADDVIEQPQDLLKEQYSALEETRADLVALYFVADPYLAALGILSADDQDTIVRAEYEAYARNALVQLRRVRIGTQLEEDHMRNRQAIVNWLLAHTASIEVRQRDGKTYYVVVDVAAFRDGVARLLADVQRIKSEGDYPAAKTLFETYGVHFDPDLRDEIVRRVDRLGLPSYTAFVMPKLEPVRDASGAITDIDISYPCDLTTQMLEYSQGRRE
jgi:dipeptidyl-peptidase III